MRMPFGTYEGYNLDLIESGYLVWLVEKKDDNGRPKDLKRWPGLSQAAEAELRSRRESRKRPGQPPPQPPKPPPPPPPPPQDRRKEVEAAVKRGFAALAMLYHGDRGGSDIEMRVVNEAHGVIMAALRAEKLVN